MKKFITGLYILAIVTFLIDWGVMGLKIFDGNYDITVEAYIGLACFVTIIAYPFYRLLTNKCPYCGKVRMTNGKYCSYCGKEIQE